MTKPSLPSPILATLVVATLLTSALLSTSYTFAQGQTLTSLEQEVFDLVNQQRALNIDDRFPDLTKEARAGHAKTAMLFSRTNTLLSIPMLVAMTGAQTLN